MFITDDIEFQFVHITMIFTVNTFQRGMDVNQHYCCITVKVFNQSNSSLCCNWVHKDFIQLYSRI